MTASYQLLGSNWATCREGVDCAMDSASAIRHAVSGVNALRQAACAEPQLGLAIRAVKRFQQDRFSGTYVDLAQDPRYRAATQFFLTELYGDADFIERDAQFSRVAGVIQRILPAAAVDTAVALARLHGLSEQLDQDMGRSWLVANPSDVANRSKHYIRAWRMTKRVDLRNQQLELVLDIGAELALLTRKPGLRSMLRAMRGPANIVGLSALQQFLETGFHAFSSLAQLDPGAKGFLRHIQQRESRLMSALFDETSDGGLGLLDAALANSHVVRGKVT